MERLMLLQDTSLSLIKWDDKKKEKLFSNMCSPHYTHVSEAGFGLRGSVHYCLRTATVTSQRRQFADSKGMDIDYSRLTDKIIVAKVSHKPAKNKSMKDEIATLKAIHDQSASHHAQEQFFQLLNWDRTRDMPQWFTTSTFPMGCSLEELQYQHPLMPEEFTWLVFTQLLEALDFLHNVCDPPIAHGDLFAGNIMIGYPEFDPNKLGSLPQLKLIDFEGSRFWERNRVPGPDSETLEHHACQGLSSDILQSISILYVIVSLHPAISDHAASAIHDPLAFPDVQAEHAKLHVLSETLKTSQQRAYGNTPWVLQSLYKYFGPHAYEKLATISESAEAQMRDIIFKVAWPKFEETQRKLVQLIETMG
ncbi:hypothetical protein J1614_008619 [Plenodomus biglobosus]|nr:hypothetical protein J1614_008619 [Plenodomus biglobosus]